MRAFWTRFSLALLCALALSTATGAADGIPSPPSAGGGGATSEAELESNTGVGVATSGDAPCAAGTFLTSVDAGGALTCSAPAAGDVTGTDAGTSLTADLEEETHATEHEDGGGDEVTVENLPTAASNTSLVLKPDGAGGVSFGAQTTGAGAVGESVLDHGAVGDGTTSDQAAFQSAIAAAVADDGNPENVVLVPARLSGGSCAAYNVAVTADGEFGGIRITQDNVTLTGVPSGDCGRPELYPRKPVTTDVETDRQFAVTVCDGATHDTCPATNHVFHPKFVDLVLEDPDAQGTNASAGIYAEKFHDLTLRRVSFIGMETHDMKWDAAYETSGILDTYTDNSGDVTFDHVESENCARAGALGANTNTGICFELPAAVGIDTDGSSLVDVDSEGINFVVRNSEFDGVPSVDGQGFYDNGTIVGFSQSRTSVGFSSSDTTLDIDYSGSDVPYIMKFVEDNVFTDFSFGNALAAGDRTLGKAKIVDARFTFPGYASGVSAFSGSVAAFRTSGVHQLHVQDTTVDCPDPSGGLSRYERCVNFASSGNTSRGSTRDLTVTGAAGIALATGIKRVQDSTFDVADGVFVPAYRMNQGGSVRRSTFQSDGSPVVSMNSAEGWVFNNNGVQGCNQDGVEAVAIQLGHSSIEAMKKFLLVNNVVQCGVDANTPSAAILNFEMVEDNPNTLGPGSVVGNRLFLSGAPADVPGDVLWCDLKPNTGDSGHSLEEVVFTGNHATIRDTGGTVMRQPIQHKCGAGDNPGETENVVFGANIGGAVTP